MLKRIVCLALVAMALFTLSSQQIVLKTSAVSPQVQTIAAQLGLTDGAALAGCLHPDYYYRYGITNTRWRRGSVVPFTNGIQYFWYYEVLWQEYCGKCKKVFRQRTEVQKATVGPINAH